MVLYSQLTLKYSNTRLFVILFLGRGRHRRLRLHFWDVLSALSLSLSSPASGVVLRQWSACSSNSDAKSASSMLLFRFWRGVFVHLGLSLNQIVCVAAGTRKTAKIKVFRVCWGLEKWIWLISGLQNEGKLSMIWPAKSLLSYSKPYNFIESETIFFASTSLFNSQVFF